MVIYFGKYKGKDLEEIPSGYLKWLAENCEDDEVATAADDEYNWRTDHNKHFED